MEFFLEHLNPGSSDRLRKLTLYNIYRRAGQLVGNREHWLLFGRTQVQFLAPTGQLATVTPRSDTVTQTKHLMHIK